MSPLFGDPRSIILAFFALTFPALFITSCIPAPTPTFAPSPSPTLISHAPEIRFGLVREPTDVNVWALFDERGASYANYAVRWETWPRLFTLSIPDRQVIPQAAGGLPSPVIQAGEFFIGTVTLRSDLKWTDGASLTAEDVAFTVNTALAFELGFDWKAYLDFAYLDHAQALDPSTVRFYFKRQPNVGLWQYGALQAPTVQKAYWEPKIVKAAALLPEAGVRVEIAGIAARQAILQQEVAELDTRVRTLQINGLQDRQLERELNRKQGDLNAASNSLAELNDSADAQFDAARQALYSLADEDEPTLGNWMPAGEKNGLWVNQVNPDFPFAAPRFDRATYRAYPNRAAALTALEKDEIDVLLAPDGLSADLVSGRVEDNPALDLIYNASSSARFLAINPTHPTLADPAFRRALSCLIDRGMAQALIALPLESFVSSGSWQNVDASGVCAGPARAVEILKSAGYTWQQEPGAEKAGVGLILPDGSPFPRITLLSPSAEHDPQRAQAAAAIEQFALRHGIPLAVKYVHPEDIRYAVFSSRDFDLALLGYRLSAFPGYLCDWFADGGPFVYGSPGLNTACDTLKTTSDLDSAQRAAHEVQTLLMADLPFIPLYQGIIYEAYRNVTYPFGPGDGNLLDGLSGVYGAPSLAVPSP